MRIHVINLDRDQDRLAGVKRAFSDAGLLDMFERVEAVDASAPGFSAPGYAPHSWRDRWELKLSEQAVFESHRKAWRRIVQGSADQGIVCEDDILVSSAFARVLPALDLARYGVVKLDGFSADRRYGAERDMNGWPVWDILEPVPSAACYAVSRAAAEELLAESDAYCETLDDFVFRPRKMLKPVQLAVGVSVQSMCCEMPVAKKANTSLRERRDPTRAGKGPVAYRALKEIRRLRRRKGLQGATLRRPGLAADLPPYRN